MGGGTTMGQPNFIDKLNAALHPTARAALDALIDQGRPRRVELCVLIDRGHRELPIQANYVGRVVQTTEQENIEVHLREVDQEDRVVLCEKI